MELKEIQKIQKKFSEEHFSNLWSVKDDEDFLHKLQYFVVGLTGEVGELANIVKKISRDNIEFKDKPSEERMEKIRDELTDCFIYIMLIANFLKIDLEEEYLKKLEFNKKRFVNYKK